ncbi:DUF6115 domain-containing protein [Brevibacillus panacihumi]|uniref:RNA polymerase subunit sigma-70 n=1 Tax=Brevibacillus panacihumi TaxID=497735 RepID=A0A3M8CP30_9BACL|nr:sigma factor-like helix-turn-helix DNA-binding protein [Brevibacillus panacihumi]RNB77403.1 RNA polymerase subunit sigma-70 [Brevibacillus panacihumi]
MDLVYIILIGAGLAIMLLALFVRQKGNGNEPEIRTQRSAQRAELEQGMQRFAKQIKQEQAAASARIQRSNDELLQELELLRKRVEELENQRHLAAQAKAEPIPASEEGKAAKGPEEIDMLALRERYRRVFELQGEGLSPDEIAKRLGVGRGEIDLIFMLAAKHEGRQNHA